MPDVRFPVEVIKGVPVLTAPEEIDITNAGELETALLRSARRGPGGFVVDLTRTRFCDSAGVSTLVRAFRRATSSGTKMRLVVGGLAVQRVLTLTGVDRLIEVYPSVRAALGSPPGTTKGGG